MSLSFSARCAPLAWGSLPHPEAGPALDLLLTCTPGFLSWPALPRRAFQELLYVRSVLGFPGLQVDLTAEQLLIERQPDMDAQLSRLALAYLEGRLEHAAISLDYALGLAALLHRQAELSETMVIGWLFGPVSLSMQLTDAQQRPLAYDQTLSDALVQHLALRAEWQANRVADRAGDVGTCLQEPFLDMFASPFCPLDWDQGLEMIERVLVGVHGCRALASTAQLNWDVLFASSLDLLIFDANAYGDTLADAAESLAAFLERGGILGWGIVPVEEQALERENVDRIVTRFERTIKRLVRSGLTYEQLLETALISTSGSLERLSVAGAERALNLCAEVAARLRQANGFVSNPEPVAAASS
jgi:hypothetical protein